MRYKVNFSDETKIQILKGVVVIAGATCLTNAFQIRAMERRYNSLAKNARFAADVINKFVDYAPGAAVQIKEEVQFDWVVKDLSAHKPRKDYRTGRTDYTK